MDAEFSQSDDPGKNFLILRIMDPGTTEQTAPHLEMHSVIL